MKLLTHKLRIRTELILFEMDKKRSNIITIVIILSRIPFF
jgi:hypothetical protein